MKKLTIILSIFFCYSCASHRQDTQLVREGRTDTLYLSNIQYNSIYVYQGLEKDYRRDLHQPSVLSPQPLVDTIFVKDLSIEYRYKLLRNTVRVIQRDSIPYEVRIETVKEVPRKYNWLDISAYSWMIVSLGIIGFWLYKQTR